ncbi:uncharacterized protein LOC106012769 isoform X2 [Aplysia californica]|uniref:Uncharacterized protein LOC106012769 isoform X2 n=1 Tax=Aplysia californica TaxID=6500 RepID=A0ABM1A726_APLCA|nr:uncharacterized protein LOC106012769 isoform X2 [Aplysia californica]
MMSAEQNDILLQCAKVLWDFSRVNHVLKKSDVMVVLGNDDPRSAVHAAELFLEGWAPFVVITGKEGTGTRGKLHKTEAEMFCDIMTSRGVPRDKIVLEMEATNTGENMRFSQNLLKTKGVQPSSVIIVTKSLMELRVALTFAKQWREAQKVQLVVSSPPLTLTEYPSPDVGSLDQVVQYLVDTFKKLTLYAELGHQAPVTIPVHVQRAYHLLANQLTGLETSI